MNTVSPPVEISRPRGKQLARASWLVFLGIVVGNSVLRRLSPGLADLFGLLAALTGLGLGAAALVYIGREGRRGILVPALIGCALNGLILLIWVSNFIALRGPRP